MPLVHPPMRRLHRLYCPSPSLRQGAAPTTRQPPPMSPLRLEEKKAYTNRQVGINTTTRSKPRQPPVQSKIPPSEMAGDIHHEWGRRPPHPAGWRVTFIMAGADGQKALVVAFTTSHLKQGSRVSFQDQSRGRMFLLQSWLKNEIARQGGHHLTPPPRYLYHRGS
jgi:hypothetical protein